ncbi:YifB family Mg chelatase-like AAA ATPase [[Bacillus] enclensis]|uniref:YifB family Mg chelatase-like AAA ATPase n=1 Tax=[Bacillus] enclensis TaxID=1402860 RepID=UPI0018DE2D2A|nr:YifB family Mg chelatase-like AAA ATPase [[Bacillus] enclensis]MBH9967919.1 YifB family Mg chelatase-like AAA ATPase [[Bacillus] enclensis]
MTNKVTSVGLKGLEGYKVSVEVRVRQGTESFVIVGLPDASVKESKERVAAALHGMGYTLANQKVIINLSPSELKKTGPLYDLSMAIGVLLSMEELSVRCPESTAFLGALSLDGGVRAVEGMLPSVLAAKKLGISKVYMPFDPELPVLELDGIEIIYISNLEEVIQHLSGQNILPFHPLPLKAKEEVTTLINFNQIIGHSYAKRALEVAAAGEHHLFMTGPPGCGKSMLAESFPSILPPLTKEAQLEVMSLYQISTSMSEYSSNPPYRYPHHSASGVSIIGGGQNPKPGEISLAHKGVLFLDEIAEFTKKTLDMLRQPLESGKVTISRAHSTVTYPASFLLIGAMNPCPCGYLGALTHYCTCTEKQIISYQNRLSGPIRDRFDLFLNLAPVNLKEQKEEERESSEEVQKRVEKARFLQYERYGEEICNGRVDYQRIINHSPGLQDRLHYLNNLSLKRNWSNRAQLKVVRLARTIADLAGLEEVEERHIWEAVKLHRRPYSEKHSAVRTISES